MGQVFKQRQYLISLAIIIVKGCHVPGESKRVYGFGRPWNKMYATNIQNEILIHQSKAN